MINIADTNKELVEFTDKNMHLYVRIRENGEIEFDGTFTEAELFEAVNILIAAGFITNP